MKKTLKTEERLKLDRDTLKPNFDIGKLYLLAGTIYLNVDKYIEGKEVVRVETRRNRGAVLYFHNGEESDELDTLNLLFSEIVFALRHYTDMNNIRETINNLYVDYYE